MLISVVIAIKNASEGLSVTLASLADQTYANFEVVVIDGNSTDDPASVISAFHDKLHIFHVVQSDTGIYNAWNNALPYLHGDWVYFLGSGDTVASNMTFSLVSSALPSDIRTIIAYGRVELLSPQGHSLGRQNDHWSSQSRIATQTMPLFHQGVFQRRTSFDQLGPFCEDFRIAGDYDMILRSLHLAPPLFIDVDVAVYRMDGVSSRPASLSRLHEEYITALRRNGLVMSWGSYSIKRVIKILLYHLLPTSWYSLLSVTVNRLTPRSRSR